MSFEKIGEMMDLFLESEFGSAEILQISGGEPTMHPEIIKIIKLARDKKIYGEIFAAIQRSAMGAGMTKHAIAKHRIEDFACNMVRDFGMSTSSPDDFKLIESVIASAAHPGQGPLKVVDSGSATMRETKQPSPLRVSSSRTERKPEA